VLGVLAIAAATVVAYLPSMHGGLLWDDRAHITSPALQSLDGLRRIWLSPRVLQQYYPVLGSVFWLEWQLWQANTFAYHVAKVAEHVLAAGLLWGVLRTLRVPGAWFAAALFALHPVSVESVAWISEQKNTLSAVFGLAAVWCYLKFDARAASDGPRVTLAEHLGQGGRGTYALALLLFVLAVLSKSVVATLPAVLLVIAWWKRGRVDLRRDVVPLLPWFLVAVVFGAVTVWFERVVVGARGGGFELGIVERLLLAPRIVWFYLGKLAWPSPLIFFYPRWTVDPGGWIWWLALVAFVVATALLVWWSMRPAPEGASSSRRAPLAAFLVFVGTLVPVLGFLNVYPFRFSYVADHFQYLAQVSVFALVAGVVAHVAQRSALRRRVAAGAGVVVLATCGWLTWKQNDQYGYDAIHHYQTILAENPTAWIAYENWGDELQRQGRFDEAVPLFRRALEGDPRYFEATRDLAVALDRAGHLPDALPYFEQAARLDPDPKASENLLGVALLRSGRVNDAISHLERAVSLGEAEGTPIATFYLDLGRAYVKANRLEDGVKEFRRARALAGADSLLPDYDALLADALVRLGREGEAEPHLRRAVDADAGDAVHRLDLGRIEYRSGRYADAERHLSEAIRLQPDMVDAYVGLAFTYHSLDKAAEARQTALQAIDMGRRTLPPDVAQQVADTMAPLLETDR
jgi:tetratricopeptide (TPR) repeat protein